MPGKFQIKRVGNGKFKVISPTGYVLAKATTKDKAQGQVAIVGGGSKKGKKRR